MEYIHMGKKRLGFLEGRHAKAKKRFLLVLLIVFVVTSSCFCLERVPIIKVKADVVVVDEKPVIQDIEVNQSYVDQIQNPIEDDVGFPSVEVWAITNNRQISRAVEEYSGEGIYTLDVGFTENAGPKDGDLVEVVLKITDKNGKTLARKAHMMIWGGFNATNATWNATPNGSIQD